MKDYLEIANSSFLYKIGAFVVVFVLVQATIFLRAAWKEGERIGLDRKVMWNAVKSSAVFSVVPSLPILLSLMAMAPILGLPVPWIRLSVIGAVHYELMAADVGARSMGITGLGGEGFTAEVFANSIWVMTVGIIWGLLICIFFLKKYLGKMGTVKQKDSEWGKILVTSLFFGLISGFVGEPLVKGGVPLATILSSAAIMVLLKLVIDRFKVEWLNNFALSFSMIGGMALAILFSKLF
ncbi:MAG: DUF5058 family protein [Firmicutes bacterium]|nr:DUF5058 family protein [Bacillota bacterium]